MTLRQAILHGAMAAERLHRSLGIKERLEQSHASVDVFGVISELNVPMLFRPLDKLLGAYLPDPLGIVVTTERQAAIQRFTGAHELGHFYCKHTVRSFDDEQIITGSPFVSANKLMEAEANSFAAHFLMPNWLARPLLSEIALAVGTDVPGIVYQTSLRLGCSYEATWRTLLQHRLISTPQANECGRTPPKSIKQALIPGLQIESWRETDVWLLTEHDEGREIQAGVSDVFVVRLRQGSSGGYLWDADKLKESGFAVLKDHNIPPAADHSSRAPSGKNNVGAFFVGSSAREFWLSAPITAKKRRAAVEMRRPWEGVPKDRFSMYYSVLGPETPGYSRAERERRGYEISH